MSDVLNDLEPRSLWGHFSALCAIPRPSKHEERVVAWVLDIASRHGWEPRRDGVGNIVLPVPATEGLEAAPVVVLQSHLDMVCEKNRDVEHDFMNDPIRPRIEDGWVYATGTTLGADNGIGVAAALAVATDPAVRHGPLELLFTLDEETGLTGAQGLDGSLLEGRILVNLDSEEDGKLFVGCAGGADCHLHWPFRPHPAPAGFAPVSLRVAGLRGGHSGLNIHEERGNAIQLLVRTLRAARKAGIDVRVAGLQGGAKHNAIPREADASLAIPAGDRARLDEVVRDASSAFRGELAGVDPGLRIELVEGEKGPTLDTADSDRLLDLLNAIPHGVLGMSRDVPGLVETSNNLAVVEHEDGEIVVTTSARSSVDSRMYAVVDRVGSLARLAGATAETTNAYPGWKPDLDSRGLRAVRTAWTELYGEPEVTAVHAGLECGLLGEKVPGLDMISFGPQIEGAHSPDERVRIESVGKFWKALARSLELLASGK